MSSNQSANEGGGQKELIRSRAIRYRAVALRHWWIPLLAIIAGVAYQGWSTSKKSISFHSNARIIFTGRIALPEGGSVMNEDAATLFGNQSELIQSSEVRRLATERVAREFPDLTPVDVGISVSVIPRTDIMALGAEGAEPKYVQAYLNALITEYIETRGGMREQRSRTTAEAISAEAQALQQRLQQGEQELLDWQKTHNLVLLQGQGNEAASRLTTLKQEVSLLEEERKIMDRFTLDQNLERALDTTTAAASATSNPDAPDLDEKLLVRAEAGLGGDENAASYLEAKQRLLVLQAEMQQLLEVRKPEHFLVVELREDINKQEKLLEILRQQNVAQLESQKEALDSQIAAKKEQVTVLEAQSLEMSQLTAEFDAIKARVDRERALYERLVSGVQSVTLGANLPQDGISVLERATEPYPIIPSVRRAMIMGGIAGLVLGCGVLFLLGIADDRVMSVLEMQSTVPIGVVGLIPTAGSREEMGPSAKRSNTDDEPMVEAFRNLRSWWLFTSWEGSPPKSVVITSCIPQEGKSTIAANFAVSLAYGGAKTLLVDADLRRGKLHKTFKVEIEPGLGNALLSHELMLEDVCRETTVANLTLVPRGRIKVPSGEALSGVGIDRFIAAACEKFDYVIFDTSPVLAVDDVSMVAPKVDTTLFVVRKNVSSARLIRKAIATLEDRQVAIAGLICNDIRPASSEFPYYKYGYHPDDDDEIEKA